GHAALRGRGRRQHHSRCRYQRSPAQDWLSRARPRRDSTVTGKRAASPAPETSGSSANYEDYSLDLFGRSIWMRKVRFSQLTFDRFPDTAIFKLAPRKAIPKASMARGTF